MSISNIDTPWEPNKDDKRLLRLHFGQLSSDWEKDEFDPLKARIVSSLRNEQEGRCCYCKIKFRRRKQNVDIEHIIPKSRHPKFTFSSKNLSLSCKACNSTKSYKKPFIDQSVADASLTRYPRSNNFYNIIHPHFDDYFEHIEILDEILIHSISEKGDETVEYCGLYEPELALDKASDIMHNEEDIKGLFLRLILELPTSGFDTEDDIFDRLEKILDIQN